jgi:hypothetical protein
MVALTLEWWWVIARVCITPTSEGQSQKGRRLISRRSFGSSPDESSILTKAIGALLFP